MPAYVTGSLVNSGVISSVGSYSTSVNVGTGSDRLLVVEFLQRDTGIRRTITSITYNGVNLSHATGSLATNGTLSSEIWYLMNPAAGSNTLSITFSGTLSQGVIYSEAYTGIHQTSALDQVNIGSGNSAAPSVSVTPTEDNELIVGCIIHERHNSLTVGSGETSLADDDNGAWVTSTSYAVQTTAAAQDVDWTATAADIYAMSVATFKEAAAANSAPTIALNTADDTTFNTTTPTLTITGSDPDADPLTYEIEISTNPAFTIADGDTIVETFDSGSGLKIHPNPSGTNVDDRPGQSFTGNGGILKKIELFIGHDTYSPSGTMYLRIYEHAGTYGTSSAPVNAADPADTPTSGWIAISDAVSSTAITTQTGEWIGFTFGGSNQIVLNDGTYYLFILDWIPTSYTYDNTFAVHGDSNNSGTLHAGNLYIDGASEANNGPQATWDLWFRLTEAHTLLQKASDTDSGFSGSPDSTDPFTAGQQVSFTVQAGDALDDEMLYYWRARANDPSGTATWSDWSAARTFTVSTSGALHITSTISNHTVTSTDSILSGSFSFVAACHAISTTTDDIILSKFVQLITDIVSGSDTTNIAILSQTIGVIFQGTAGGTTPDDVSIFRKILLSSNITSTTTTSDNSNLTIPSTGWVPSDLASLSAWYDFSDASTLFTDAGSTNVTSDNDLIYQVNDKSTNGYHVTQTTESYRPKYQTAQQNGNSVARLDGVNNFWSRANVAMLSLTGGNALTYVVVLKQDAATARNSLGGLAHLASNMLRLDATYDNNIRFTFGNVSSGGNLTVAQPTGWDDTYHILVFHRDDTAAKIWVSGGSELLSGTFSSATYAATATWWVGRDPYSSANDFDGDLCEIIVCTTALSVADLNSLGDYLDSKWGITWTPISDGSEPISLSAIVSSNTITSDVVKISVIKLISSNVNIQTTTRDTVELFISGQVDLTTDITASTLTSNAELKNNIQLAITSIANTETLVSELSIKKNIAFSSEAVSVTDDVTLAINKNILSNIQAASVTVDSAIFAPRVSVLSDASVSTYTAENAVLARLQPVTSDYNAITETVDAVLSIAASIAANISTNTTTTDNASLTISGQVNLSASCVAQTETNDTIRLFVNVSCSTSIAAATQTQDDVILNGDFSLANNATAQTTTNDNAELIVLNSVQIVSNINVATTTNDAVLTQAVSLSSVSLSETSTSDVVELIVHGLLSISSSSDITTTTSVGIFRQIIPRTWNVDSTSITGDIILRISFSLFGDILSQTSTNDLVDLIISIVDGLQSNIIAATLTSDDAALRRSLEVIFDSVTTTNINDVVLVISGVQISYTNIDAITITSVAELVITGFAITDRTLVIHFEDRNINVEHINRVMYIPSVQLEPVVLIEDDRVMYVDYEPEHIVN